MKRFLGNTTVITFLLWAVKRFLPDTTVITFVGSSRAKPWLRVTWAGMAAVLHWALPLPPLPSDGLVGTALVHWALPLHVFGGTVLQGMTVITLPSGVWSVGMGRRRPILC